MKKKNKGFTLIEMLVVVLIIGILAGIALPQYQMAVTKAKVASILPLMRRWKDAMAEYKLQHGSYLTEDDGAALGVNWPSDWENGWDNNPCNNSRYCTSVNFWDECFANEEGTGSVYCKHWTNDGELSIYMYQPDDPDCEVCRGKIVCCACGEEGNKVCKALGGRTLETDFDFDYCYSL